MTNPEGEWKDFLREYGGEIQDALLPALSEVLGDAPDKEKNPSESTQVDFLDAPLESIKPRGPDKAMRYLQFTDVGCRQVGTNGRGALYALSVPVELQEMLLTAWAKYFEDHDPDAEGFLDRFTGQLIAALQASRQDM